MLRHHACSGSRPFHTPQARRMPERGKRRPIKRRPACADRDACGACRPGKKPPASPPSSRHALIVVAIVAHRMRRKRPARQAPVRLRHPVVHHIHVAPEIDQPLYLSSGPSRKPAVVRTNACPPGSCGATSNSSPGQSRSRWLHSPWCRTAKEGDATTQQYPPKKA